MRRSTASRPAGRPVEVANSGSLGMPARSLIQARSSTVHTGPTGIPPRGRERRRTAFLATLADAVDAGSWAEVDVGHGQAGQFADPQPGRDGEGEHGVVAPPRPGGLVAGAQQVRRRVAEQGVDRGEPGVAGADAVAADLLEVGQEPGVAGRASRSLICNAEARPRSGR